MTAEGAFILNRMRRVGKEKRMLLDPLLRHIVRGVNRASGKVTEEGLVWRDNVVLMQPINAVVGEIDVEVIALLRRLVRFDRTCAAIELRIPLAVFAALEAIEVFKAEPGRPVIERTHRADFTEWRIVPLTE